jgi:RNA polymerase sigma-70 factor (ECF subfamily)
MNSTQPVNLKHLPTDAKDTDVMCSVQAHDRRALEKLYLTYYGPLARFLSRVVTQTSAVDEIINDSFMTIWKCAREFQGESRAAAWIFGIAYRTALQSMKAGRSQRFAEMFRGRVTNIASASLYNERFERRLNRLPFEERVTLTLAYQMRFSIDEIAEITQVAPVTVKLRMFQARGGFRD